MYILGISAFYHDSAACLIFNGEVIFASQEERFSRIKNDSRFPSQAIKFCLLNANITCEELESVVYYEKPFLKFERILETQFAFAPKGFLNFSKSIPSWVKDKLFLKKNLSRHLNNLFGTKRNWSSKLLFSDHHLSHSASAFYPSPFENAAILTIDGVGEWATTTIGSGYGATIKINEEIRFPHSLGLLYSTFTSYLGFKVNSGEYKVMGLAPYGNPRFSRLIMDDVISLNDDGSFALNMEYFDFATGAKMASPKFQRLFGFPAREPESEILTHHCDLAASIQQVLETAVLGAVRYTKRLTGEQNLCLSGGVALNCVANSHVLNEGIFKSIWIQPAAGDAGSALGAALAAYHIHHDKPRKINQADGMSGAFLGHDVHDEKVALVLKDLGATFSEVHPDDLYDQVARHLADGRIVGWVQGRSEFGPRSLGNRSILADPTSTRMQRHLNMSIKFRESFRPFAPCILEEESSKWFQINDSSPYMLFTSQIHDSKRTQQRGIKSEYSGLLRLKEINSSLPATTHVDFSSRVQTVDKFRNPKLHRLLQKFYSLTGVPALVNTSFNVRGEPIVNNVRDAYSCFMKTDMDLLIVDRFCLIKSEQESSKLPAPVE